MSTMDEDASTTDALDSVDLDETPGAEPSAESSPASVSATAAAADEDVEVVSAPNREDTRERLKQAQRGANHAWPKICHYRTYIAQETSSSETNREKT